MPHRRICGLSNFKFDLWNLEVVSSLVLFLLIRWVANEFIFIFFTSLFAEPQKEDLI